MITLILALVWGFTTSVDTRMPSTSPAPEVEIWSFEQFESYLEKPESKLRVINFWATWCAPCIRELPLFDALAADHKNDVDVLLVSLDFVDQKEKKVIPFIDKRGVQSPVVILGVTEYNEWIDKVDESWSGAIPATLMVLPNGDRKFYEREFEGSQLEDLVNHILD